MSRAHRSASNAVAAAILGLLVACTSVTPRRGGARIDAPAEPGTSGSTRASTRLPDAAALPAPPPPPPRSIDRANARWVAVGWSELPGWEADRSGEAWAAFQRGCERAARGAIADVCAAARLDGVATLRDGALRQWLQQHLQPYRVESLGGSAEGLVTGYFEPLVDASRSRRAGFDVPLYAPPAGLQGKTPFWTRREIDTLPPSRTGLQGREIAWLRDRLDALLLQVQGSGRLVIREPDGSRRLVRIAFAAHNGQPYRSVGRWLVEQGELDLRQASWPAIRDWARRHPARVDELLWSNPRVVFFREEALPDPSVGPNGAAGVALTPGRSIAVDPQGVPYGSLVWLDTTEPLASTPLRRLVVAQDTGSAIVGAVRADYFWGWGAEAEAQAGRMKQPLRMWVLWPLAH